MEIKALFYSIWISARSVSLCSSCKLTALFLEQVLKAYRSSVISSCVQLQLYQYLWLLFSDLKLLFSLESSIKSGCSGDYRNTWFSLPTVTRMFSLPFFTILHLWTWLFLLSFTSHISYKSQSQYGGIQGSWFLCPSSIVCKVQVNSRTKVFPTMIMPLSGEQKQVITITVHCEPKC